MKIQVRQGVFETNSSSTHSLSVFKTSDWERFKKGEMVITGYPEESRLVDINDVDSENIYNIEDEDQDWHDYDYYTYDTYSDLGYYDEIIKQIDDYTIMSLYGEDY